MLDLTAIERVGMTNRVYQIQQRIANIQEQFKVEKFPTDFQSKLDKEIERQDKLDAVQKSQNNSVPKVTPTEQNNSTQNDSAQINTSKMQVTEEEVLQAAKIILAVASGNVAVPNVVTPSPVEKNIADNDNHQKNSHQNSYQSDGSATEDLLNTSAQRNGVDPALVRAVALAESGMNQNEISDAGAIGVMQLMPGTAAALGVDPYDKAQNIEGGVRFLRQMLDQFGGNVPNALAAYNAGPGAVQRYGGIPPYKETQNYVGRILDIMGG